jgi:hypothetical protein
MKGGTAFAALFINGEEVQARRIRCSYLMNGANVIVKTPLTFPPSPRGGRAEVRFFELCGKWSFTVPIEPPLAAGHSVVITTAERHEAPK